MAVLFDRTACAALAVARELDEEQTVLVILPDGGRPYLSKIFDDKWMTENGFLEAPDPLGSVADLLRSRPARPVISLGARDSLRVAIGRLKEHDVSQLPVVDGGRLVGLVSEIDLLNYLLSNPGQLDTPVGDLVEADYATVTPQTKVRLLRNIFNDAKAVFVLNGDELAGVITKIDLIEYLATRTAVAA